MMLESLVQHGKDILKPAADYFYNIFQKDDGECHHTLEIAEAAQMFNPIFLAGLSDSDVEVVLHDLAEKLKATKFMQFENDKFKTEGGNAKSFECGEKGPWIG